MQSSGQPENNDARGSEDTLPFVAPCRVLAPFAALGWLRLGWRDLRAAPAQSLSFGAFVVAGSYAVTAIAWQLGGAAMLLAAVSGFVFVAPIVAIAVYEISRQLQHGRRPSLGAALNAARRQIGNELVFMVVMLVVFLVWARAASMVHVFFPVQSRPDLRELAPFLAIGSAVGAIFAAIVFAAAAFSLPMIADRRTDTVTAVVTSINAVLRNKFALLVWAASIAVLLAIGFATAFLGLAIVMPWVGHATWHAYRETIDASRWPPLDGS